MPPSFVEKLCPKEVKRTVRDTEGVRARFLTLPLSVFVCLFVCFLFLCLFSYSQIALGYTVHSRLCRCSTLCRGAALHSVATALAVIYSLNASLSSYSSCCNIFFMLHSLATAVVSRLIQALCPRLAHSIRAPRPVLIRSPLFPLHV